MVMIFVKKILLLLLTKFLIIYNITLILTLDVCEGFFYRFVDRECNKYPFNCDRRKKLQSDYELPFVVNIPRAANTLVK